MNEKNKKLIILISILLIILTSISFNIFQFRKIKELNSELDYCEYEKYDLENRISELESELETCKSEKNYYFSQSNNNSSTNWSLNNDKDDLERKIRDLESELDDCERKLKDCN